MWHLYASADGSSGAVIVGRAAVQELIFTLKEASAHGAAAVDSLTDVIYAKRVRPIEGVLSDRAIRIMKTGGALGGDRVLAYVKPSTPFNNPRVQAAGSSFMAAAVCSNADARSCDGNRLLFKTAYSTVISGESNEAKCMRGLLQALVAKQAQGTACFNDKIISKIVDGTGDIQLVGPVDEAHDFHSMDVLPFEARHSILSEIGRGLGAVYALDLVTGNFLDRMNNLKAATNMKKVNRGNLMFQRLFAPNASGGDNDDGVMETHLVIIDTDIRWPTLIREPICAAAAELLKGLRLSRPDAIERLTDGIGTLMKMAPVEKPSSSEVSQMWGEQEGNDLQLTMMAGVEAGLSGLGERFPARHCRMLALWLGLAQEDADDLHEEFYCDSRLLETLGVATRPISPDSPLDAAL